MNWINRLKEPSTWAGLAVLVPLVPGISMMEYSAITTAVQAVAAALAVLLREKVSA